MRFTHKSATKYLQQATIKFFADVSKNNKYGMLIHKNRLILMKYHTFF